MLFVLFAHAHARAHAFMHAHTAAGKLQPTALLSVQHTW